MTGCLLRGSACAAVSPSKRSGRRGAKSSSATENTEDTEEYKKKLNSRFSVYSVPSVAELILAGLREPAAALYFPQTNGPAQEEQNPRAGDADPVFVGYAQLQRCRHGPPSHQRCH